MRRSSVVPSGHQWIATLDATILLLASQVNDRLRPTQRNPPLELEVISCVYGVISPVMANMTLDGLEAAIHASVGKSARARRPIKTHVIRYADDFVVNCASKEVLESQVLPAIRRFMAERGLELSEEKTRITHITEGFDFLEQNVRKYGTALMIKLAKKSIKSLLDKIRGIIKGNKAVTQELLIRLLNPVIRGWAMYHRHVVAKQTFSFVDAHIWRMLWQWAKRRHPNKNLGWVKSRYFRTIGHTAWNFTTRESTACPSVPSLGRDGRSCCPLHRTTAFSPSRASRLRRLRPWPSSTL